MTIAAPATAAQRSHGTAALTIGADGRIGAPRQSGCARLFVPRSHRATAEAVFVNTAGGLTGGDRLESRATLGAGARLACTTQAAERIYRSNDGPARVTARRARGARAPRPRLPPETVQ
ncbi:urease accessory protein UreD, partial [Rhodobacteraceae bacterium WD3A24]